ncbi:hypothetical protein [Acrocarpospora sp. B8E8]|uniref:hypothetical protein n=1 Tax=Acrocarpospora sp. B8E8 TaxID=3153572 RepID=UPI00325ECB24
MPIYLQAPAADVKGVDGKGWNRLSLSAHIGEPSPQCALRPRTYATLWERQDTARAAWGHFGQCVADGGCQSCPIGTRQPYELTAFTPDIMVRLFDGWPNPAMMNHPERGADSTGHPITWDELGRLDAGWELGRRFVDDVSEGFWLHWRGGYDGTLYGLQRLSPNPTPNP